MGLPKFIIKKYGITKKAWKAYRNMKSSGKYPKAKSGTGLRGSKLMKKNRRRVVNMARRKKKTYFRKRSKNKILGMDMMTIAGAMGYGAVRSKISTMIAPYTSKIPLGNISDEVGMGVLFYVGKKLLKNKTFNSVANAGLIIESARIGEAIAMGQLGIGGQSKTVQVTSFR